MDIFKFIVSNRGTIYKKTQEPFIRLITVYTCDVIATDIAITAKSERMKKARCVGLCKERMIKHIQNGPPIANPEGIDIQNGCYELIYYLDKKEIKVFKLN